MAHALVMPRQGNTVESCILTRWRKAEGQTVTAEEILCEVETDKAAFEVPAGATGIVLKLLAAEGDDVPVLTPIAVIGQAGEDWQYLVGGQAASAAAPAQAASPGAGTPVTPIPAAIAATPSVAVNAAVGVSPRARVLASREAIDATGLVGSGPGGRVIERDVRAALESRPPLSAALRAAVAAGATVPGSGSGPGGRAILADLASPMAGISAASKSVSVSPAASQGFPGPFSETPIRSIRKVIAERMRESLATTAQFTLSAAAQATRLQALRARMKASPEALGLSKVTVGDLVLFAASRVLAGHPNCNAQKLGDTVRVFERVHLGLAVDTPRGLMVPVIRSADLLSLAEISSEAKRLATACVEGKASPDELSGSTFTVSNLGALGVEYFTPVINAPEVCVLGVGAILPKPFEAADGSVAFAPSIGLSLTSDHQVVDGAPAARLLKDLVAALADIDLWLAK
ncbi:MAG: dihydrolipoamide acetyltransferase family protein [Spirochaetota bacterium]